MHMFKDKEMTPGEARAARTRGKKRSIEAKALYDVIAGLDPDGPGAKYNSCYRTAVIAWQAFLGLRKATYEESRSTVFKRYTEHLDTIYRGIVTSKFGTLPKLVPMPTADVRPAPESRPKQPSRARAPSTTAVRPSPAVERPPVRVEAPPDVEAIEVEPSDDPDEDYIMPAVEISVDEAPAPRPMKIVTKKQTPEQLRLEQRIARRRAAAQEKTQS